MSRTQWTALLVCTLGGLATASALDVPLVLGFVVGFAALLLLIRRHGFTWRDVARPLFQGMIETREVIWILVCVGILIPAWTACGTIPYMIDLGIGLVPPAWFLTGSFLLSTAIALLLGTSTGTLSFVGIPLIGVSATLGVPLGAAAGALVSGAFVGERSSPFSSARKLVGVSTATSLRPLSPELLPTALIGVVAAAIAYILMDGQGGWSLPADHPTGAMYAGAFAYSPWLLLPPAALLAANLLRWKTRNAFLLSIAVAIAVGMATQAFDPQVWLHYIAYGYDDISQPSLYGKGLVHMIELVSLIAVAGAFNGTLQHTKLADGLWESIVGKSRALAVGTVRVGLFGLVLCLVCCTQTLPIMMSGRNLLPSWRKTFTPEQLNRVVSDTTLLFAPLVPWNLLALLCATILGVDVLAFLPYAVFLWTVPIATVAVSTVYDWKKKRSVSVKSLIR